MIKITEAVVLFDPFLKGSHKVRSALIQNLFTIYAVLKWVLCIKFSCAIFAWKKKSKCNICYTSNIIFKSGGFDHVVMGRRWCKFCFKRGWGNSVAIPHYCCVLYALCKWGEDCFYTEKSTKHTFAGGGLRVSTEELKRKERVTHLQQELANAGRLSEPFCLGGVVPASVR